MTTIQALLDRGRNTFDAQDGEKEEAEYLLSYVLQRNTAWLAAHCDEAVNQEQSTRYLELINKRASGTPVAYLTGKRAFWKHEFAVDESVLIPRPETELLVEIALEKIGGLRTPGILDLGTGSGIIAISLALALPQARILATDQSAKALDVARTNAKALGASNVEFVLADWYAGLPNKRFDLIASNPPYVAENDPYLNRGDLRFEPDMALASGQDGLSAIRTIIQGAHEYLNPNGHLVLEHGFDQAEAVRTLLEKAGFQDIETRHDLADIDRATFGTLKQ